MIQHIAESIVEGHRLGRHVEFDDRSRDFPVAARLTAGPLVSKIWARTSVFNQGNLGSCTGNAVAGLAATAPLNDPHMTEATALKVYELATTLDSFHGSYPPKDTGSTGLAALKAGAKLGLFARYEWGFSLDDALRTVAQIGPVVVGVNWYEGFDSPDAHGLVAISGQVRGGHEFEILGIDVAARQVVAVNSWGRSWGLHGRFGFSFDDLDRLLHEQGECGHGLR